MTRKPNSTRGQLDKLLGYQLRRASAAAAADFASELGAVQLRPVQFAILALVADNEGISQSELCRALSVQKANMAPLVSELEGRGLLGRKPAPSDRRVQMLTLTAEGERQLPVWRRLVARHERRFFGSLTAGECDVLARALRKLWASSTEAGRPSSGPGA